MAADIPIKVSPPVLKTVNGKLPGSVTLAAYADPCDNNTPNLTQYRISLTGGFLTPMGMQGGQCMVMATVTVDPNAPAGDYDVVLLDPSGHPVGRATLSILDVAAGPIPPGLAPQVDIMWEVLSQNVCGDVFGSRVGRYFYCIEVKIGNDSGYPLQVAGIGFSRTELGMPLKEANASYASARAVLANQSNLSPRNVIYHSLQGTGLLMAGFTPFFHRANPAKNWASASSLVNGALVQAFDLVFPDPTKTQLTNLDDQSLRDGTVIQNNAHVRTTVFVDKESLTVALAELQDKLNTPQLPELPTQAGSVNNLTEQNTLRQKQLRALQQSLGKEEAKKALEKTRKNSQQPYLWKGHESTVLVRLALGNLVLVGEQIKYLQRVQIQSNASSAGAPTISSQPAAETVTSGQTATLSVMAAGTPPLSYHWYEGVSGDTSHPVPAATNSTFTSPPLAATTSYWVQVSNAAGSVNSATATITVKQPGPPTISNQPAAQTVTSGQTATLSVTAAGTGPLVYQWYQGSSSDTSHPMPGATTSSLTTPALAATTSYWVRVGNSAGTVDSAAATVTVH
jgi:hypothetical protein